MTDAPMPWRGRAQLGLGWGLFVGHAGDGVAHAHHAVQILLANTPQCVWTTTAGSKQYVGVVIGADVEHRLEPTTESVTLLYLDPHSTPGRRLQRSLSGGLRALDGTQVLAARRALGEMPDAAALSALAAVIAGDKDHSLEPPVDDLLIQRLIESLPEILPDRLTVTYLAMRSALSESRFSHRFRKHTGLPLRPYLRWRRLLTAMTQVMAGQTLTDAAVAAGFSDAAHFTRTFRRHFGIAPRTLLGLQAQR